MITSQQITTTLFRRITWNKSQINNDLAGLKMSQQDHLHPFR